MPVNSNLFLDAVVEEWDSGLGNPVEKEQGEVSGIRYLMFHTGCLLQIYCLSTNNLQENIFYIKEWKIHPKTNKKEWKIIFCRVSVSTQIFQS